MSEEHLEMWQAVDHVDHVLPAIAAALPWPQDALRFATR
jgi:hypothetical protein